MYEGEESEGSSIWLLDIGCLNHMTGRKNLFFSLDESMRHTVKLGNDKEVEVLGKGSVVIMMQG